MSTLQINQKNRLSKLTLIAAIGVALCVAVALVRIDSVVYATESSASVPVSSKLGELTMANGFAEVIEAVSPAVVSLAVTKKMPATYGSEQPGSDFFRQFRWDGPGKPPSWFWDFMPKNPNHDGMRNRAPRRFSGVGAGVVFDASGLIVTNHHVIENAADIQVTLHDGKVLNAQVVGVDRWTDLAVLRVDTDESLPYAAFGDSEKARVGEWAIAIGDPFGLSNSVSLGIISAMGRNLNDDSPKVPLLQIDAAVNRGNSGGPLFNSAGEVIGINTMIISPSGASAGVGFAVPSAVVQEIVVAIEDQGRVTRGWLGVGIQSVTSQIAAALNMDDENAHGALVSSVESDSPADRAGVQTGDIIVEFDGQRVDDIRALSKIVKMTKPGSEVAILVLRGAESIELRGTVDTLAYGDSDEETRLASSSEAQKQRPIGASVATLTPDLREKYQLPESVEGVVITDIQADSAAAKSGLQEGHVIVSINNKSVRSSTEAKEAIDSAVGTGNDSALLLVADGKGEQLFVVVALS